MHVYCDESGNTGVDLFNKDQPLFAIASTCIDNEVATRLITPLLTRGKKEAKYNRLKCTASGQAALLDFFSSPELNSKTSKVYLVDKSYYVITHLVDKLVEPTLFEHNIDLYAGGGHVALTNLWHYAGPYIFPNGQWGKILDAFVRTIRSNTPDSYIDFYKVVDRACRSVRWDCREFAAPFLMVQGRLEEFIGCYRGAGAVFDPAADSFIALIHFWMNENEGRFKVTHDQSKPLRKSEPLIRSMMSDIPSRIIGYANRQVELPLRISELSFANSKDHPQIQVADLLAGLHVDVASALTGRKEIQSFHEKMKETIVQETLVGGLIPSKEIKKEDLPTIGQLSLVDGAVEFMSEVNREKTSV